MVWNGAVNHSIDSADCTFKKPGQCAASYLEARAAT
jgi:hypothetical protein